MRAVIDPFLHERERKTSYAEASNPARVSMLHARMMEVRAVQQEEATHKAIAAKAAAEAKRILEMERKRIEQPNQRGGRRLGGGGGQTTRSSNAAGENNPWNSQGDGGRRDYDPLNPNSGHSRGYRPARRTVRRS